MSPIIMTPALKQKKFLLILLCYLFLINASISAQNTRIIDSLMNVLKNAKHNTTCFRLFFAIAGQYKNQGNYDKSIEYFFKAIKIAKDLNDKNIIADCYNSLGDSYYYQGNYSQAIVYNQKALKIMEQMKDKPGMTGLYINIGRIHHEQRNYLQALEYYEKALKISEEYGNIQRIGECYKCMGNICLDEGDANNAIEHYNKALKIFKNLRSKVLIANCFSNIGEAHILLQNYQIAENYYQQALKMYDEIGEKYGIVMVYSNIANLHIALADSSANLAAGERVAHLDSALLYGKKSLIIAREIKTMPQENLAVKTLMNAYKKLGKFKKAMEYSDIFITNKDSMFNKDKNKTIAEIEDKYQTEKKEKEIELLNKDRELRKTELRRQKAVRNYLFGIVWLIVLLAGVLIIAYWNKRKANRILKLQNAEILEKSEEIRQQSEEIRVQAEHIIQFNSELDLMNKQFTVKNEELNIKNIQIVDSINYAKLIQDTILPTKKNTEILLPDSFIFFRPRDIVSGDFYWIYEKQEFIYFAVVDCTGHGIPGAFMSMIGYTLLTEIMLSETAISPAEILDKLNEKTISTLKQNDADWHQNEGMDISICRFDRYNRELIVAGARQKVYIFNNTMNFIEGEQFSIGGMMKFRKEHKYKDHFIKIEPGTSIYLYSDGYIGQFGGPNNDKFMNFRFEKMLSEIHHLPVDEQTKIIEDTFSNWIGDNKQTDDVTVFGIRINQ
ncbi:MAG: tetratricopeptide repeat protein [Bacteroidia bacterium]|nr:tetratricopeptide repeat protein [Bacteroidia bacterium]